MSLDMLTLSLQIGGPLFTLAALAMWLNSRHIANLITLVSNHLSHVEEETIRNTETLKAVADAVDRLAVVLVQRD